MKKHLLNFAMLMMAFVSFTSCDDNDSPSQKIVLDKVSAFVINAGNAYSNINGSITAIDVASWAATPNAFKSVNGVELGGTVNDAVVYGSKLYVVATDENTVWVVDKKSMKKIAQLSTTTLMGNDKGKQPRHLAVGGGYVFVDTYDGFVAQIDTTSYACHKTIEVGSYPEGMCVNGNYLFVANSDLANQVNASVALVNLNTYEVTQIKSDLIKNPKSVVVMQDGAYVLDMGYYETTAPYAQKDAHIVRITGNIGSFGVEKVVDATAMACDVANGFIYFINAPYGSSTAATYNVYNLAYRTTSTFTQTGVDSPTGIFVDPVTNYVYITSMSLGEYGYADYFKNGYMNVYNRSGELQRKVDVGVDPEAMVFAYDYHIE